jgi:hypothetical protein
MNILLLNDKEEVVSIYAPNDLNYQKDNKLNIFGKKYKVVDIEKYRKLNLNESVEQVTLELKRIKN